MRLHQDRLLYFSFSCLCRWVIRPDAVQSMHSCVDDFLRIKLFQVHITDMKMNLSCCFEGHRLCALSSITLQKT
jgi:hypothetical protein